MHKQTVSEYREALKFVQWSKKLIKSFGEAQKSLYQKHIGLHLKYKPKSFKAFSDIAEYYKAKHSSIIEMLGNQVLEIEKSYKTLKLLKDQLKETCKSTENLTRSTSCLKLKKSKSSVEEQKNPLKVTETILHTKKVCEKALKEIESAILIDTREDRANTLLTSVLNLSEKFQSGYSCIEQSSIKENKPMNPENEASYLKIIEKMLKKYMNEASVEREGIPEESGLSENFQSINISEVKEQYNPYSRIKEPSKNLFRARSLSTVHK